MRVAGAPREEIAAVVGYSCDANAIRAVKRVFGRLPTPDREMVREVWRERHEVVWRIALQDAEPPQPRRSFARFGRPELADC